MLRASPGHKPQSRQQALDRLLPWVLLSSLGLFSGCIFRNTETQDSMPESEFVQMQSNCGKKRNFLFAHVEEKIPGRNEKNWGCWYAASTDKVYGTPTDSELKTMFTRAKPIVRNYINMNTLTHRLNDIDQQRTTVLWLGIGVAMLGCGVAAGGTFGIALSACALLGSATAGYDIYGGDPSQGASEGWRKLADLSESEVAKIECNAVQTISEQARFIDKGGLMNNEGASRASCPRVSLLASSQDKIHGIQPGASEIKNIKPATAPTTKP
ncbi:MAG: hypothetical protein ACO3A4_14495 [Silvanigrellaceae bacterium]